MMRNDTKSFIGYEYCEITKVDKWENFYADGYLNFGWKLEKTARRPSNTLLFKRDRKILNKVELTRLQRQFDSIIKEINQLEKSKDDRATIIALIIGIIGCAFIALSVFAVAKMPPHIIACILWAIPGFICWILPYFIYKKLSYERSIEIAPLIEEKYNQLYETCESGNALLFEPKTE